jgi:hypothetical protein
MANNTNIQFYKDTRIVFETPNAEGKTAIGSADATVQGFEIEYNLLTTPEAFKISPLGINYTSGATDDTTLLPRIAQVGSLLQSLETPPDATTLQVNKKILLTDTITSGSIGISGTNTLIDTTGNLILNPVGNVDLSGNTLDMASGEIHKCPLIHSQTNNDIIVEGLGTADVILKTGTVDRLTVRDDGFLTFQGGMTYDNATDTLTATNFNGLVSNATNCVNSEKILVTTDDTDGNYFPTFVKTTGSTNKPFFIDTANPRMTYNPSTGVMSFTEPPICTTSATSGNEMLNFNNFTFESFTPTLVSSGGGAPTYNATDTVGRFMRVNKLCIVQIAILLTGFGTMTDLSGNLTIPLPVAVSSLTAASFTIGAVTNLAPGGSFVDIMADANPSATAIALGIRRAITDTGVDPLLRDDISSTFLIRISGSYFV